MKKLTYKTVLKYLGIAAIFIIANKITDGAPLSLAYYIAFALTCALPVPTAIIYILTSFIFSPETAIFTTFSAVLLCVIFSIYRSRKKRPKFELICYIAVALLPYIFGYTDTDFIKKLVYSAIIALLAFVLQAAFGLCFVKQFKRKGLSYEIVAFYIFVIFTSLGGINLFGYKLWYDIALTAVLYLCYYFKSPKAFIPAFVLPVALALYSRSIEIIAVFMIFCASVLVFSKTSRLLSALSLFVASVVYNYLCGNLFVFDFIDYVFAFAPVAFFLFTPKAFYRLFKDRILKYDEPEITREIINAERGDISAKLYGISDAFLRLETTLNAVDDVTDATAASEKIADEVCENICKKCENYTHCMSGRRDYSYAIEKIVKAGISKNKASLSDIPRNLSYDCLKINDLLYEINRLIGRLSSKMTEKEQAVNAKNLITMQAGGLSDILKNLAYSFSDKIEFGRKNERILFDLLASEGIVPKQLVRAGKEYHILLPAAKTDFNTISSLISECEKKKYRIFSKTDVGNGILAVFAPSPDFDACFGFAKRTKADSSVSGDNYALKKIDEGKFLVALCDGMGSGEKANENSQAVISLIENFFAAGIDRDTVLNITSNLISTCFDDGFSTLDSAIIDLYSGICDILKIGATFGFLIGTDGVRIIENNSLPLGVLENVEPTHKTFTLSDGDTLIIISDGVSDAFFSSTDAIDFLSRENCPNPQTFADKILDFALKLNENIAKDDMTVLVVKFYHNNTAVAA